jgi:hypothetical protein
MAIFLPHIYSPVKYEAGRGEKISLLSGDCAVYIIVTCIGEGALCPCSSAAGRWVDQAALRRDAGGPDERPPTRVVGNAWSPQSTALAIRVPPRSPVHGSDRHRWDSRPRTRRRRTRGPCSGQARWEHHRRHEPRTKFRVLLDGVSVFGGDMIVIIMCSRIGRL